MEKKSLLTDFYLCEILLNVYPSLIHQPDTEGATPLHYASLNGDEEIVQFLLGKQAPQIKDFNGETPLHLASLNGHHGVAKLLLKHGADVNALSSEGMTSLHLATTNSQAQVIRVLLSHPGTSRDIVSKSGKTAFDIAIAGGLKDVLDSFDDDKREKLVKIANVGEELKDLLKVQKELEAALALDIQKYTIVTSQVGAVAKQNAELDKQIDEATANSTGCIDESVFFDEESMLRSQIRDQRTRNSEIEEQMDADQKRARVEKMSIDNNVLNAHESLNSLLMVLESSTALLVGTKTQIENARPYFVASSQ